MAASAAAYCTHAIEKASPRHRSAGMDSSSLNRRVGEGSWTSLEIKRKSSTGIDGNIMLTDSVLSGGGPIIKHDEQ